MAALAHGSIIIPTWGAIISAIIFITQREKSPFVAHQARQAVVWQMAQFLFAMLVGMCIGTFAIGTSFIAMAAEPASADPPFFLFAIFPLVGLMMLVMLGFMGYGLLGAYRAFKGELHVYPLIGSRLEAYVNQS